MFEIIFDEEAVKFLESLPKEITKRIISKILQSKENPFHFFEKLSEIKGFK